MYYYHNPDPKVQILTPTGSNNGNGKWLIWLPDDEEEGNQPTLKSQSKKKKPGNKKHK